MLPSPKTAPPPLDHPKSVQLPKSSTRLDRPYAHCKVIESIRSSPLNTAFEGKVYPPGAVVPFEELGPHPVVLECAGRAEKPVKGIRTPIRWILWAYESGEWRELASASAVNWEWTESLRLPAVAALNPNPKLHDVLRRGQELADEIMRSIEHTIGVERQELQVSVLTSVYDRVAGKIAECA